MTKTELIKAIASRSGSNIKESQKFLNTFTEIVTESLIKNDSVVIHKFGAFKKIKREERTYPNPQTKKTVSVPAHFVAKFVPYDNLRNAIK